MTTDLTRQTFIDADRLDRDKSKSCWAGTPHEDLRGARPRLQLALPLAEKREAKEKAAKDKAKEKLKAAKAKARAKERLKANKAKAKAKAKTKVKKASKGNTPKARAHPPPIGRGKEVWVKWVLNGEEQRL